MPMHDGGLLVVAAIWLVFGLAALAAMAVWIWALVDCLRRDFPEPVHKVVWVLVIILLHFLGAILYLAIGRQQDYRAQGGTNRR